LFLIYILKSLSMAESMREGNNGGWLWVDVMRDLEEQGGLKGVTIDPTSANGSGRGGHTERGTHFFITWCRDQHLVLTVSQEEQALVDAFTAVLGYKPFCRYTIEPNLPTFEWDKQDPEKRFKELVEENRAKLERI
jgi:hypothetical protein